jgi:hypothetical protein
MLESILYPIINFFNELGLKGLFIAGSIIGGSFLFYAIMQKCTEPATNLITKDLNSIGIASGAILFGIVVCFPLSSYVFDKFNEPKIVVEGKNAELIKACVETVKEINADSIYPADLNCTKIAEEYGGKNIRSFKQIVEIKLIAEQALRKKNK